MKNSGVITLENISIPSTIDTPEVKIGKVKVDFLHEANAKEMKQMHNNMKWLFGKINIQKMIMDLAKGGII
jgi:hypothetical protein